MIVLKKCFPSSKDNAMKLTKFTLYYKPTCPYCVKVLNFLNQEGIELEMKDTLDPKNLEELKSINHGKTQVPCLVVNKRPMLESDDIINFLRTVVHG